MRYRITAFSCVLALAGIVTYGQSPQTERHLANIKQLTSGGENAEAYFSPDGKQLIYQTNPGTPGTCDQIFTMNVDGSNKKQLSKGGRTTCGYFFPDGKSIVYASTHLGSAECPPRPSFSRGYVWPIYEAYDIFRASPDGSNAKRLTNTPGYDAEATIGPDGRIVFTSVRDGDMEIYSMNGDGSDVRRLTNRPGPDGGPWFSPDGKQIIFRGRPISEAKELADYQGLLKEGLWRPTTLEIFVMNRDGSNLRQVTKLGGANFAPAWHPDGKRIIFERQRSKGPRFRHLHDQSRRHRSRTDHVQQHIRRIPDVFAGWKTAGVWIEPECEDGRGDERVCGGVEGIGVSRQSTVDSLQSIVYSPVASRQSPVARNRHAVCLHTQHESQKARRRLGLQESSRRR
jgi:Tol biopolymer transport system component